MNYEVINLLKKYVDKGAVLIKCTDGEEIIGEIVFFSETEKDVICKILFTNRPDSYGELIEHPQSIPFSDIDSVSLLISK